MNIQAGWQAKRPRAGRSAP